MDADTLKSLLKIYPGAGDVEPSSVEHLFDIADLIDDIQRRIRELAEETGMPSLHFFMLEHVALQGGAAPLGDLLVALNVPKQSATYVIDQLEADELVERRRDKHDRRRIVVALTKKGRHRLKADLGPFYAALLGAMQSVPTKKRKTIVTGLTKFRDALAEQ